MWVVESLRVLGVDGRCHNKRKVQSTAQESLQTAQQHIIEQYSAVQHSESHALPACFALHSTHQ